ncbi:MAG TPA: DUF5908 family protein [Fluviicola sp.]|nr:DUF5908 family protein [Fluviicola sp.]
MPIEIKELVIKINVEEKPANQMVSPAADQAKLVKESVEQVVELLKQQKER